MAMICRCGLTCPSSLVPWSPAPRGCAPPAAGRGRRVSRRVSLANHAWRMCRAWRTLHSLSHGRCGQRHAVTACRETRQPRRLSGFSKLECNFLPAHGHEKFMDYSTISPGLMLAVLLAAACHNQPSTAAPAAPAHTMPRRDARLGSSLTDCHSNNQANYTD